MKLSFFLPGAVAALAACSQATGDDSQGDTSALASGHGSSFDELRGRLYQTPRADLPQYSPLGPLSIFSNLIASSDRPTDGLSIRSRRTLVDVADERPDADARNPKWLHPRGACAEARWKITENSGATGLFSAGTNVPAIVRVSSGDGTSIGGEAAGGRILGMAIKLFPTSSGTTAVRTRNIIMLDHYGFERSKRVSTFVENDGNPVYFTNVAPATSLLGKFLSTFFDRFDKPNFARPLYDSARALGSDDLIKYRAPYEIRIQLASTDPAAKPSAPNAVPVDFRTEVLGLPSATFEVVIQSFDPSHPAPQKIGTLTLGKFVVSDYCDLKLHFHHSSIEDQLEKYSDYDVLGL